MLDYSALVAVRAVVREGSFERAANLLNVTPSAISQRVKGLEDRLGAILLVRGQPCVATDVGLRLCAHLDQVRLLESDMMRSMPTLPANPQGDAPTIRIAVNGDSLSTWFPAAAASFALSRDTLLDLILDGEDQTANHMISGEVLAAVTTESSAIQGCRSTYLGALRYAAVANPSFFQQFFAGGVNSKTLAKAPMLRTDRRDGLQARWLWETLGAELNPPTHWVPSTQGFFDMLLSGLGWGMVPVLMANPYLDSVRLLVLEPRKTLDVKLYWQYSRLFSETLADLSRAVIESAKSALIQDRK